MNGDLNSSWWLLLRDVPRLAFRSARETLFMMDFYRAFILLTVGDDHRGRKMKGATLQHDQETATVKLHSIVNLN